MTPTPIASGTWIVVGATSAMARALVRALAAEGAALVLAGRDLPEIEGTAADALARGAAAARTVALDLRDAPETAAEALSGDGAGPLNVAVFAGSMPEQATLDADPGLMAGLIDDNFAGPARLLSTLAPAIEARGGTVVGVTSVAGDRGRIGNYAYGAAKAGFATYLSGLRNRLGRSGAHVITVKPGFVDTAMTWGLPGLFLVAPPDRVARDILRAVERRRDVIYTPGFWRAIMLVIRLIPERIFKKLSV